MLNTLILHRVGSLDKDKSPLPLMRYSKLQMAHQSRSESELIIVFCSWLARTRLASPFPHNQLHHVGFSIETPASESEISTWSIKLDDGYRSTNALDAK